ncbi:immediate-early protein, putative [Babesia caballi]|uniref:Immediate-early protein, putative n=1 Tax=Babesia caballi TaxID=5871 RepID=A0AAV4LSB0_BABCB|nr:immediate-early protein, putative [Babesia caballi]
METNIVNSRKRRAGKADRTKGQVKQKISKKRSEVRVKPLKAASVVEKGVDKGVEESEEDDIDAVANSEGEDSERESEEGSDGAAGDDSEPSDLSDYDMEDVSDDESDSDSGSENLEFSDPEDSGSELEGDLEPGCRTISTEAAETMVKHARKLGDGAVRRIVGVYGSFIRRAALQQSPTPPAVPSDAKEKAEGRKGARQRRQRRGLMASRSLSKFRDTANRYAPSSTDVYNYVVIEAFSVVEQYVKAAELAFSNARIADVATLFRRFLSSALVQLGFRFEDLDLCRCALNMIGSNAIMPWVVSLKSLHREVVKVACSLLTHHGERAVRVHALQVLQAYLRCLKEDKYHRILISQPPATGLKVERLSSQQAKTFCNRSLNFLLNRSYRTQISASSIDRTLGNFGLFKLSQNCLAELYNEAATANLYTFVFKSIRDLGINVRREWLAANDKKKRTRTPKKDSSSHGIVLPVYSWGFVEAVNVWVTVLVRCRDRLEALSYPLVTVITAAVKAKLPQIGYMPFVLHMITAQNQLADGLERFVPVASCVFNLLEQLRAKDIDKMRRVEAGTSRKLLDNADDIMVRLRLTKKQLHASETYRMLYRHVALVLTDHVGLVSLHPSFPEFSIPITVYLKRYLKGHKVDPGFRSSATKLLSLMEESASVVREKRSSLDLQKRAAPRLKLFASDAKAIPVHRYRMAQLLRYQHISREKVEGTLSAATL